MVQLTQIQPPTACGCALEKRFVVIDLRKKSNRREEHNIWHDMKRRCADASRKDYARYGARGIRVCDRWRESFENFYADMGPRPSPKHTIDRIDNNGDYSPENCRWATASQQQNNRRQTVFLVFRGEKKALTDWARELGFSRNTLQLRYRRGWDAERMLTTPRREYPMEVKP
jgi:hypothetical protein